MKKSLSVFLTILMIALTVIPAFAEGETQQYYVNFEGPSAGFEADAYNFIGIADPEDPISAYVQNDPGKYFYYNDVLTAFSDIPEEDRAFVLSNSDFYDAEGNEKNTFGQYALVEGSMLVFSDFVLPENKLTYLYMVLEDQTDTHFWDTKKIESGNYNAGDVLEFDVATSEKYDVSTANVYVNNEPIQRNQKGVYAVVVDQPLTIRVMDKDPVTGEPLLLRNHFLMTLTSGEGYSVKPLKNATSKMVYYGDSYSFRVKITAGFTGSGMKVIVQKGKNQISELLGEEADFLSVIGTSVDALSSYINAEIVPSDGVDEDGYRTYTITNVTSDCRIIVSGVQEESRSGIMSFLKRILKFILDLLGLGDKLPGLTTVYDVSVDLFNMPADVSAEVIYGKESHTTGFTVMSGDSVTVKLTSKVAPDLATVTWTGKTASYSNPIWTSRYNRYTGETTYTAVYYIDNITADMTIAVVR